MMLRMGTEVALQALRCAHSTLTCLMERSDMVLLASAVEYRCGVRREKAELWLGAVAVRVASSRSATKNGQALRERTCCMALQMCVVISRAAAGNVLHGSETAALEHASRGHS